jgi:hypothetical protein
VPLPFLIALAAADQDPQPVWDLGEIVDLERAKRLPQWGPQEVGGHPLAAMPALMRPATPLQDGMSDAQGAQRFLAARNANDLSRSLRQVVM